jgi:hypothetical protein
MSDDLVNTNTPNCVADAPTQRSRTYKASEAMVELLAAHDGSLNDKIATVKTAQLVDKGRFETAFKTLMKR